MMNKTRLNILLVVISFLLYAVFIVFWMKQVRAYREEKSKWIEQVGELTNESRKSVIIRRVGEQLEEVAYQQKDISDERRLEALKQKKKAEEMQGLAEEETGKALEARTAALEAYRKVEIQKRIADEQRIEALRARQRADTLAGLALGRSLGSVAVNQFKAGEQELAKLLGYYAWKYTWENGGDCYQPAVLGTLSLVSGVAEVYYKHQGAIRDLKWLGTKEGMNRWVSVGECGEVVLWTERQGQLGGRELYRNPAYDFRQVVCDTVRQMVYAAARNGVLLELQGDQLETLRVWESGCMEVCGLILTGTVPVVFSRNGEAIHPSADWREAEVFYKHNRRIVSVNSCGKYAALADEQGTVVWLDGKGKPVRRIETGEKITALGEGHMGKQLVVGCRDGRIRLIDTNEGAKKAWTGHISAVTGVCWSEGGLISVGYDGKLNVWKSGGGKIQEIEIAFYPDWLYCVCAAGNGEIVLCGGRSGALYANSLSPGYMADRLKKALKRDFTAEERAYYGLRN